MVGILTKIILLTLFPSHTQHPADFLYGTSHHLESFIFGQFTCLLLVTSLVLDTAFCVWELCGINNNCVLLIDVLASA